MQQGISNSSAYTEFGQAVEALGHPGFFAALNVALSAVVPNDYPQFWLFCRGKEPRSLYHTLRGKKKQLHVEGYIAGAYKQDPIYQKSVATSEPQVVRITEIAATRFRQTEYFRKYHVATGNIDEATFIIHVDKDRVINLPIMRVQGSGRFSPEEIERLKAIEPLVRQLVLKHWSLISANPAVSEDNRPTDALGYFGGSVLSDREQEVARLLLLGHSAKSAAERLDISPETLARHRQNIYRKLDIGSLSELFSLFIASLPTFEQRPGQDPLIGYLATPGN